MSYRTTEAFARRAPAPPDRIQWALACLIGMQLNTPQAKCASWVIHNLLGLVIKR